MQQKMKHLLAAMFLTCAASGAAQAATVYVRYDGIGTAYDTFGLLGTPGQTYKDAIISVVHVVDSRYGSAFEPATTTSTSQYLGSQYADVTIENAGYGYGFHIDNNDRNYYVQNTNDGFKSSSSAYAGTDNGIVATNTQGVTGNHGDGDVTTSVLLDSARIPKLITTPFTYKLGPGDVGSGSFYAVGLYSYDCDQETGLTCGGDLTMQFKITRVTQSFTYPSAVPLPASAPMFGAALMALGAIGYGVKRKKAAAAT